MSVEGILPFTRNLITQAVKPGDLVVDATMGNGIDTLFLAKLVGTKGKVLAYDVQPEALSKTAERLHKEGIKAQGSESFVELLLKGHETVGEDLNRLNLPLAAAMFNLGYRPGSDKTVVTLPETTLQALYSLREHLKKGGIIAIVVYSGHESGKQERDALLTELSSWDQKLFQILQYRFINQQNDPPFLLAIQKK